MANKRSDRSVKDVVITPYISFRWFLINLFIMFFGPLFLIYLVLRCDKNQCLLLQMPLVIPWLPRVYFSMFSIYSVLGYIIIVLLLAITHVPALARTENQAFSSLLTSSFALLVAAYLHPFVIKMAYNEYLRILCVATAVSYILSVFFFILAYLGILTKDLDYSWPMAIFYGNTVRVHIGDLDLKYFFYVYAGMIGWALLDLIILLNMVLQNKWNTSVIFLALTQCFFIGYTLYFEQYMRRKPFNRREGLGFFWLMRVLMYLPFLHSLPVYYAATTEVFLPKPLLLLNSVIYLFGIIVYISSSQQKENFAEDNLKYKNLRSVAAYGGKRFLISGYWGMVQKPDYIGYMIIWFSWTVACGFSYLSLIVLTIIYGSVFSWTQQATRLKQHTLGNSSWVKYEQAVPNKLIPYLY